MAFGDFVGYQPGPAPGLLRFKLKDGRDVDFGGPQAEDLKQRIDLSNSIGQLANNSIVNPAADIVPQAPNSATDAAPARQGTTTVERPGNEAPEQQTEQRGIARRGNVLRDPTTGVISVIEPGSPGVSREQLQRQSSQGVALPSAESETVQNRYLEDPAFQQQEQDILAGETELEIIRNDRAEAAVLQAQTESDILRQVEAERAQESADAQRREIEIEQRVQKDVGTADVLKKDFAEARVDPTRAFSGGRGTAAAFAAAIGAAFSGFSQGYRGVGGPNPGIQALESIINRDIRAQEADIAIKGRAADNAIAQARQSGLDAQQARALAKESHWQWVESEAAARAAKTKIPQVQSQWAELAQTAKQQSLLAAQERYNAARGNHSATVQSQVAYPRAGTSGGVRQLGGAEQLKVEGQLAELEGKQASTAKTVSEIGKAKAAERAVPTERTTKISKATEIINKADELINNLGETGAWRGEYLDPTGVTAGGSRALLFGQINKESRNKIEQTTNALKTAYQSGAGIGATEGDAVRIAAEIEGGGSYAERLRGADAAAESAARLAAAELRALQPEQQDELLKGMSPTIRNRVLKHIGVAPQ